MTTYNDVPAASNSELEAKGYVWTFDGYIKPAEEAEFSFSGWLENTYGDVNDYMRDYRITNDVYFEGGWLGDSVEFVNNKLINPVIDNTLGLGLQLLKEADSLLFEDMQLPPIWGRYTAVPDLISEFGMSARYSAGALLSLGVKVPNNKPSVVIPESSPSPSLIAPENISASKLESFSFKDFGEVKPGLYYQAQRYGQRGTGEFFSNLKPLNSMDAEELFNIKAWGNNAEQLGIFEIKPGLQAWQGGVKGGSGTQLYIPRELHSDFVKQIDTESLFVNELKWITRP
jgi:hypothetical protein